MMTAAVWGRARGGIVGKRNKEVGRRVFANVDRGTQNSPAVDATKEDMAAVTMRPLGEMRDDRKVRQHSARTGAVVVVVALDPSCPEEVCSCWLKKLTTRTGSAEFFAPQGSASQQRHWQPAPEHNTKGERDPQNGQRAAIVILSNSMRGQSICNRIARRPRKLNRESGKSVNFAPCLAWCLVLGPGLSGERFQRATLPLRDHRPAPAVLVLQTTTGPLWSELSCFDPKA